MALRDVWNQLDLVSDNGIGEPLSPWTVSADFRRVVAELGLPRTRFHDLRHAHATQLLSAGVHVKAVSERLGPRWVKQRRPRWLGGGRLCW